MKNKKMKIWIKDEQHIDHLPTLEGVSLGDLFADDNDVERIEAWNDNDVSRSTCAYEMSQEKFDWWLDTIETLIEIESLEKQIKNDALISNEVINDDYGDLYFAESYLYELKEIINNAPYYQPAYHNGAVCPLWFEAYLGCINIAITSGGSSSNEWYCFKNRAQAIDWIGKNFNSQSFIDQFIEHENEYYYYEDVIHTSDGIRLRDGSIPADIRDICIAESRF